MKGLEDNCPVKGTETENAWHWHWSLYGELFIYFLLLHGNALLHAYM